MNFDLKVAVAVKTLKVGSNYEDKLSFLSEAEMMKRFEHRVCINVRCINVNIQRVDYFEQ